MTSNTQFQKYLEKHFSEYSQQEKTNYIRINSDISRFDVWTEQVNQIKSIHNSIVLSSGCGSGGDLYYFLKKGAKKVYGIETSKDLAFLANKRLDIFNPKKFKIDVYDGARLPYRDNTFDIVFSMHVIEHTHNPYQYLDELIRVTKNEGIIYIELPNKFYPIEQHTHQLFIQWIPKKIRKLLTDKKIFKRFYDLDHFLSPVNIYAYVKKNRNISIVDSNIHSYDGDTNHFKLPILSLHKLYKLFTKTSYKIVLQKSN